MAGLKIHFLFFDVFKKRCPVPTSDLWVRCVQIGSPGACTSATVAAPPSAAGDSSPGEPGFTTPWGRVGATWLSSCQPSKTPCPRGMPWARPDFLTACGAEGGWAAARGEGPAMRKPSATGHLPSKQSGKSQSNIPLGVLCRRHKARGQWVLYYWKSLKKLVPGPAPRSPT